MGLVIPVALLCVTVATSLKLNSGELQVTFLHTNDVHSRFEETNGKGGPCTGTPQENGRCYGGIARRAKAIAESRASDQNVILVDAGDEFQGPTLWFYVYKGMATAHFMNLLQYDVMALGNHEFDNGLDDVVRFLENLTFPVISCNMNSSAEPTIDRLYSCSRIIPVGDERIAFVGYTTLTTKDVSKPGKIEFSDEVQVLQEEVSRLISEEGINKIVALGHSGIDIDTEIARKVPGIDVVIGGHSHSFLYSGKSPLPSLDPIGEYPTLVTPDDDPNKRIPVVHAYAFGTFLGRLVVTFSDNGDVTSFDGLPILLDHNVQKDPEILAEFDKWNERVEEVKISTVGIAVVELQGDSSICGAGECNLGNLIVDSWVAHLSEEETNGDSVSLAVINAKSIGSSIQKGNITIGTLNQVLAYGDTVDVVILRGEHIIELLETAVAEANELEPIGTFLQVAGMMVEYDLLRSPMERVLSVRVLCSSCAEQIYTEIDASTEYKIAMNDYMAGGGGGFDVIKERRLSLKTGDLDIEILIDHIRARSPIRDEVEGRITVYDSENRPPTGKGSQTFFNVLIYFLSCVLRRNL